MKLMLWAILVSVIVVAPFTSAETIRGIDIDFVNIGHAGNAADTQVMTTDGTTGYGAVAYNYSIGTYDVTNAQWNTFVAGAGAPTGSDGGYSRTSHWTGGQQPVNAVSWYEAAQFCNYLTSGDKSKGAYQFSSTNANPGSFLGIDRTAAQTTYGTIYVIPTEDEWYKAAYFKPDGSGYSLYANGTSTGPSTSDACYNHFAGPWNVGTGTMEQNGTYDMMGNVWQYNETLVGGYRGSRGGSYQSGRFVELSAPYRISAYLEGEYFNLGFRVASIPEPATLLLLGLGSLLLRKRPA